MRIKNKGWFWFGLFTMVLNATIFARPDSSELTQFVAFIGVLSGSILFVSQLENI